MSDLGLRRLKRVVERDIAFRVDYQHPDQGDDPLQDVFAFADMALCKDVARVIHEHYWHPGWRIEASHKEGIVKFNIPVLMGDSNWGVVRIKELETDPNYRAVMRVAGEILERYRIPRAGITEADFALALQAHPLGYRGKSVPA